MQLVIQGDHSKPITDQCNCLTFRVEADPITNVLIEPTLTLGIAVNDGDALADGSFDQATQIYFSIDMETARSIANQINSIIELASEVKITLLEQSIAFKTAQMACVRGEIGEIQITKTDVSDQPGVAFYSLEYFNDVDRTLLHSIENVSCYVPAMQEEQYEWLRALVGGNHQNTSSIKVTLVDFSLEEIRTEFEQQLHNHVAQIVQQ